MSKIEFATVIYSITLANVEVPDNASDEDKAEIILKQAETFFPHGLEKPIIHDCSDPDLID